MKNEYALHKIVKFVVAVLLLLFLFPEGIMAALHKTGHDSNQPQDSTLMHRQQVIHSKSPMVMPFMMNKVTHYFIKTDSGGVLEIKAKDAKDSTQISLIRNHLEKEQSLFSTADFRDPKTLHGMDMPGLKVLSKSKGKYSVDYSELPDGARLTFSSKDSVVIDAIHTWFDAQLRDHGSDAKSREE
jgi:hypothetical protein